MAETHHKTKDRRQRTGRKPSHGACVDGKRSPTYRSWKAMIERCGLPSNPSFATYGGRGIIVCDRWKTFANFLADMGERPDDTTLDRRDSNGPYAPENCRWATRAQQNSNRRDNLMFCVDGEMRSLPELAAEAGISSRLVRRRLYMGWDLKAALHAPNRRVAP